MSWKNLNESVKSDKMLIVHRIFKMTGMKKKSKLNNRIESTILWYVLVTRRSNTNIQCACNQKVKLFLIAIFFSFSRTFFMCVFEHLKQLKNENVFIFIGNSSTWLTNYPPKIHWKMRLNIRIQAKTKTQTCVAQRENRQYKRI